MTAPAQAFAMRRVTALTGPYGSGKTELSLGLAQRAALQLPPGISAAVLADLDVLKPYFRSREMGESLRKAGVRLIAPGGGLANTDLPILPAELRGSIARQDLQIVLDVGGDPVGARALGSISDVIGPTDYDLLLVLNRYRPFMDTLEHVVEQAHAIAAAACLRITGIISNTNMLEETTEQDVLWGLELSREVARELSVPVRLLAIPETLAADFQERIGLPPLAVIRRQMMPDFLGGLVLAPSPVSQPRSQP